MNPGPDPDTLPEPPASEIADLKRRLAESEAALRAEQRRFESVFRQQFQFTALLSPEGHVLDYNEQLPALAGGVPREAVLGRLFWDTDWWLDLPELRAAWPGRLAQAAAQSGPLRLDDRFISSSGELRHAAGAVTAVRDDTGALLYFVVQAADNTEHWRAELQREAIETRLREAQKLEAIGTLAGGVAHDFNNIVGAILGNSALARETLSPTHPALGPLDQVDNAAQRARLLVRQLLTFSRRHPHVMETLPLQSTLREALTLLHWMIPPTVQLQVALGDDPAWIRGDAAQLQQVLMNLCSNAWLALPGSGGLIEVRLQVDSVARCVELTVRDDGIGMDAETRSRIFEPFFTTREVGQGAGLGLAVSHGIVVEHGGSIGVETAPGRGSSFQVRLPLVDPPALTAPLPATLPRVDGAGCRVIYVDDDETMSMLVEALLRRSGFQVSLYRQAAIVLDALAHGQEAPDIVVTDYNMPGMSGIALARALAEIRPGLPVMIVSGFVTDSMLADAAAAGVRQVLRKEDTLEELCVLVQRLAAAPRGGVGGSLQGT